MPPRVWLYVGYDDVKKKFLEIFFGFIYRGPYFQKFFSRNFLTSFLRHPYFQFFFPEIFGIKKRGPLFSKKIFLGFLVKIIII